VSKLLPCTDLARQLVALPNLSPPPIWRSADRTYCPLGNDCPLSTRKRLVPAPALFRVLFQFEDVFRSRSFQRVRSFLISFLSKLLSPPPFFFACLGFFFALFPETFYHSGQNLFYLLLSRVQNQPPKGPPFAASTVPFFWWFLFLLIQSTTDSLSPALRNNFYEPHCFPLVPE